MSKLPEFIFPSKFADRQIGLSGNIPLGSMKRLEESLSRHTGEVAVDLTFARNGRFPVIEGHISADLKVICQNCLESLDWTVNVQVKVVVINDDGDINFIPESFEPLLVEATDQIVLADLVEDELLLSLPNFPKHAFECRKQFSNEKKDGSSEDEKKPNPFAVLADYKITGEN